MIPGAQVRILAPFAPFFPGVYVIESIEGTTAHLEGVESAFDISFLEVANV